jgi:glycosyl transferase family 25
MVDQIKSYVINLKIRPDKYGTVMKELEKINVIPERFEAVYTKELPKEYVDSIVHPSLDYTVKYGRSLDNQFASYSPIGCTLSHVALWKKLLETPEHDKFLIFEDDVLVNTDKNKIDEYVQNLDKVEWDVAYLGYIDALGLRPGTCEEIDGSVCKASKIVYGTHAYLINKAGAKKLLDKVFPIVVQLDSYMSYMIQKGVKIYRPTKSYLNQTLFDTDIQSMDYKPIFNRYGSYVLIMLCVIIMLLYYLFRNCQKCEECYIT